MSSLPMPLKAGFRPTAKHVFWTFVVLMFAYVLHHNEHFLIDKADPYWQHIVSFRWYLLLHGLTGACALILGPMQFVPRLRNRYPKFHRVIGRIFIIGALLAPPVGTYLQHRDQQMGSAFTFTLAAGTFAVLWMTTTLTGFFFALRRKIEQHRRWMTRSYAYAIVFLEVRVISGLGGWERNEHLVEATVWICLAAAPLLAEFALQWQEQMRKKPLLARAAAAD